VPEICVDRELNNRRLLFVFDGRTMKVSQSTDKTLRVTPAIEGASPIGFGNFQNCQRDTLMLISNSADLDKRMNRVYPGLTPRSNAEPLARTPLWTITEADRSATTFLLPSEY
jgi:hypothetical protein